MKVGMLFVGLAVFAGAAAVVMLLWNALIPAIIGWTAICYWQAAGLMILCRLLFGGVGRFGHTGHMLHHGCGHHGRGHERMIGFHEKMRGMSRDERREYIRDHMAGFADCGDSRGDSRERGEKYPGEDTKE